MSNVHLYLDNSQYYPGSTITGKAVCTFRSGKEIRKIRIRFTGHERTHWTNTERYYDSVAKEHRTRTVSCNGDNDIINKTLIVHGEGTLGPGQHVFPFTFTLPDDLPGTFQHHYGGIEFSVKATVDRPWKLDYEDKKVITIISPIKLQSLSPSLQHPGEWSDEKTVCCFCCANGPITLDMSLEKQGFVVGENINVKLYCLNMSNVTVENMNVRVSTDIEFKTTHPNTDYKHDKELIATSYNSGVGAHGEKTYSLTVNIPSSTVIPNFSGCTLFSKTHKLEVIAELPGCHTNLSLSTDIGLGHIPYPVVPVAPTVTNQYQQPVPPYPVEPNACPPPVGFQPIHMPGEVSKGMPMPGTGFPSPSAFPSAPQEGQAPSAPSKLEIGAFDARTSVLHELPPPTYDEAAKNFGFDSK